MEKEYYIQLDGQKVPVTEEVYRAYMQPVWREAKQAAVRAQHEYSYDAVQYEGTQLADPGMPVCEIAENTLLLAALDVLDDKDRALIYALYFDGLSERDAARGIGISQPALHRRRDRILKKIKKEYGQ